MVAYADDDTTVGSDWLEQLKCIFDEYREVGLVYCRIDSGQHDSENGYIPEFPIAKDFIMTKMSDCFIHELGIGAGMAVRKDIIEELGGFDDNMGPGSYFRSGEDRDIAIRLLLRGRQVYFASQIPVIHFGYRSYNQGKEHTKRDFFSLGATYIKPIKCGHWSAAVFFISIPLVINFLEPVRRIVQFKKPRGFGKLAYFIQGVYKGLQTPVDRNNILYQKE